MLWMILVFVVGFLIIFIAKNDPPPLSSVYSQPGKWYYIKYWIFYVIMTFRKRRSESRPEAMTGKDAGYGMKSRISQKEMDCVQHLQLEYPLV